jgi:hypothetical protein
MAQDLFKTTLTPGRVEYAYGRCIEAQHSRNQSFADTGYRAALAGDRKLLLALEAMAECTLKLQEDQMGRLMRSPDATHGETRGTTQHQLCREAFRLAEEGRPIRNFEWIYGAAAWLCGYNL